MIKKTEDIFDLFSFKFSRLRSAIRRPLDNSVSNCWKRKRSAEESIR